ncbi:MAG TPA: nitroreductase/quinone reductase family protein [Amycolatopsis sp.]|nr:nitroreductase/quinone reductase family protein [Amycolatopsis sp.]
MDESERLLAERGNGIRQHLRDYLETDGRVGYVRDMTAHGGIPAAVHLVLRTVGRKSGRVMLVPLTYTPWVDEFVLVASKGGSVKHPDWYLNLISRPEVEFQVRHKRFSGTWRIAEGEERQELWDYASTSFKGYATYQARTERRLPVVVLTATGLIEEPWEQPA